MEHKISDEVREDLNILRYGSVLALPSVEFTGKITEFTTDIEKAYPLSVRMLYDATLNLARFPITKGATRIT